MSYFLRYGILFICSLFCVLTTKAQVPVISSFSPPWGPIGTQISINGTNFDPVATGNKIRFGAVMGVVTSATASSLTATVPPGTTYERITVIRNNLSTFSNKPFDVTFTNGGSDFDSIFFAPTTDIPFEYGAVCLAAGDFDGDGKPEFVVANHVSLIVVLRNVGSGDTISLANTAQISTNAQEPMIVKTADLDGDGKLDMISLQNNSVCIYINTGTPGNISFAAPQIMPIEYTKGVQVDDFNSDGKPDLAFALGSLVKVYKNTSSGSSMSFVNVASLEISWTWVNSAVSSGDADQDGKVDLVVSADATNKIAVFRNTSANGNISFMPRVEFTTGATPYDIRCMDIDEDGFPELITSNVSSNNISILKNNSTPGNLVFSTKTDFPTGGGPRSFSLCDVNGDGRVDIVSSNYWDTTVSVLKNQSGGGIISFAAKYDYRVSAGPSVVTLLDLDGDSYSEIITSNKIAQSVSILRNQVHRPIIRSFNPATAAPGTTINITGHNFTGTTSVKFGGVAAVSFSVISSTLIEAVLGQGTSGNVTVTTPKGTAALAGFGLPAPVINSFSPESGAIGSTINITGSGFSTVDSNNYVYFGPVRGLVTASTHNNLTVIVPPGANYQFIVVTTFNLSAYSVKPFTVTFPGATTTFQKGSFGSNIPIHALDGSNDVATGDLNGDGKTDLVSANKNLSTLSVYINTGLNGVITYAPRIDLPAILPISVTIADMNSDGKLDILATSDQSAGKVIIYKNTCANGIITFTEALSFYANLNAKHIAVNDFNSDGKPDITVIRTDGVRIYRNISSPDSILFTYAASLSSSSQPYFLAISDLNGDNKPDLVLAEQVSNRIRVYKNTSSTDAISFFTSASSIFTTGTSPFGVSIGDLDDDGKPDIAVANHSSANVSIFKNITTGSDIALAARLNFVTASGPYDIAMGDIDGDSKIDLAISCDGNSLVSLLKNSSSNGVISFLPKVDLKGGYKPTGAAISDLDNDGQSEIITANVTGGGPGSVSRFPHGVTHH